MEFSGPLVLAIGTFSLIGGVVHSLRRSRRGETENKNFDVADTIVMVMTWGILTSIVVGLILSL